MSLKQKQVDVSFLCVYLYLSFLSGLAENRSFMGVIEMYNKIFSEGILVGRIEINEKIIKKIGGKSKFKT
jgi:hypothetical protein